MATTHCSWPSTGGSECSGAGDPVEPHNRDSAHYLQAPSFSHMIDFNKVFVFKSAAPSARASISVILAALNVAVLPISAASSPQWAVSGPILVHSSVDGIGLDFESKTGFPLIAYGYINEKSGDATTIDFLRLNADGTWANLGTHTPQFPQPYDHFAFQERWGALYLGLRIDESFNLSSVLRGGAGYDGFTGCWAFGGWVWDFSMNVNGDMRAVISPGNHTLETDTYAAVGWSSYPASDAWAPPVLVANASAGLQIQDVETIGGLRDSMWVSVAERVPEGAHAAGSTQWRAGVWRGTLSDTGAWVGLRAVSGAVGGGVAWTGLSGESGMLCHAALLATDEGPGSLDEGPGSVGANLSVACAGTSAGAKGQPDSVGVWTSLGVALAGMKVDAGGAGARAQVALVPDGPQGSSGVRVVVGALDRGTGSVRLAQCMIATPQAGCAGWVQLPLPAAGVAAGGHVTAFRLKAPSAASASVVLGAVPRAAVAPLRLLVASTNSSDSVHGQDQLVLLQLQAQ